MGFMVVPYQGDDVGIRIDRLQYAGTQAGVALDDSILFSREFAGFVQHGHGHPQFADVMQKRSPF